MAVFCDAKFCVNHTGDNAVIPRGSLKYKKLELRKRCRQWCKKYPIFKEKCRIVDEAYKQAKRYNKSNVPKQLTQKVEIFNSKDTWTEIFRVKFLNLENTYAETLVVVDEMFSLH